MKLDFTIIGQDNFIISIIRFAETPTWSEVLLLLHFQVEVLLHGWHQVKYYVEVARRIISRRFRLFHVLYISTLLLFDLFTPVPCNARFSFPYNFSRDNGEIENFSSIRAWNE